MINFIPNIRPANLPKGYSMVENCFTVNKVVSDIPGTVFSAATFEASMSKNTPNREIHAWLRFCNAPYSLVTPAPKLGLSSSFAVQKADGTILVQGFPTALVLPQSDVGVYDANTLSIYLATDDFDITTLTYATEPSTAGFPVTTMSSTGGQDSDIGSYIPLSTPCYGVVIKCTPFPAVVTVNRWTFARPFLLVKNS